MDVLEQIAGALIITVGLWLIFPPIAIIVFGLMLATHGTLVELARTRKNEEVTDGNREPVALDDASRHA